MTWSSKILPFVVQRLLGSGQEMVLPLFSTMFLFMNVGGVECCWKMSFATNWSTRKYPVACCLASACCPTRFVHCLETAQQSIAIVQNVLLVDHRKWRVLFFNFFVLVLVPSVQICRRYLLLIIKMV
jgi:hypothetical protein